MSFNGQLFGKVSPLTAWLVVGSPLLAYALATAVATRNAAKKVDKRVRYLAVFVVALTGITFALGFSGGAPYQELTGLLIDLTPTVVFFPLLLLTPSGFVGALLIGAMLTLIFWLLLKSEGRTRYFPVQLVSIWYVCSYLTLILATWMDGV